MDPKAHAQLLSDRPQTPQLRRPLSIAAPETPSSLVPPTHLLQWRASDLLSRIDQDALIKLTPKIAGSYCELDRIPIIRSYMNVLIVLHDRDSDKRWVARIPYDQQQHREFLDCCVRPLEVVMKKFKSFRRPRLYHFALATDQGNPVGVDYMLLDFIEGSQLKMWDGSGLGPNIEQRKKILDQVADAMLEMLTKPVTEKDGVSYLGMPEGSPTDKPCSTTAWLYESVDRGIRQSFDDRNVSMVIDYLIMRSQVPQYVVPEFDNSPWFIAHSDLHNRNIIVDEETNTKLRGIIDWDYAQAVPLQKAAVWPKLLEFVPGDEFPDLPDDHTPLDLGPEKDYFLSVLAAKERKHNGSSIDTATQRSAPSAAGDHDGGIDAPLTRLIATCSERNFFELSHHRMRVHEQWVATRCLRTSENIRAAWTSLHDFLQLEHNAAWFARGGGSRDAVQEALLLGGKRSHQEGKPGEHHHQCQQSSRAMWFAVELAYEFERLELEASIEAHLSQLCA